MGTIAEKLTYLNGTKTELKEAINNLGGNIDNTTTFREYAQELQDIYDNIPKTTDTGTNLSLSTLKGKMNTQIKGDTQQDGTPTPDTPINIEVVTGTQEVKVENVNLLPNNATTREVNGVAITINEDKSITLNGTATAPTNFFLFDNGTNILKSGTYTLALLGREKDKVGIYINSSASTRITQIGATNETSVQRLTFTLNEDTTLYRAWVYFNIGTQLNNLRIYPMIYKGTDTSTPYTPHQEQTQTISLGDIELCKIGNYQDTIEYDVENDKVYRNKAIGKAVLNGSEYWGYQSDYNRFYTTNIDNITMLASRVQTYSNMFKYVASGSENNGIFTYYGGIYLFVDGITNVADLKTFLQTNKPIVYYVLAEAVKEEITGTLKDQIKALYNLKSYNGVTNINCSGNLSAILSVSALKGE